jgi:Winged helix-turn-helix domain (DUF2582)
VYSRGDDCAKEKESQCKKKSARLPGRFGMRSLSELKEVVKGKKPTFDWAIGWLAREDQIVITPEKRSFRIRLRQEHAKATGA